MRRKEHAPKFRLVCVGSLTQATLHLADKQTHTTFEGEFEIVSLTGTLSINGSHLRISVSDGDGRTLGGHLVAGCTIYTTAEIVMAVFPEIVYKREYCEQSGYDELVVENNLSTKQTVLTPFSKR